MTKNESADSINAPWTWPAPCVELPIALNFQHKTSILSAGLASLIFHHRLRVFAGIVCWALGGFWSAQAEPQSPLQSYKANILPLIEKHCVQCHGSKTQKGKFRIDTLAANLHEGRSAGYWHEVLDQLNEGEMPPEDEPQPSKSDTAKALAWKITCPTWSVRSKLHRILI